VFEPIAHLEWLAGRPEAALHDLGTTGLCGDRDATGPAVPESVAGRPDPPAGVTLHTQLATTYGVEPEQVLVTAGATHADFLAVAAAVAEEEDPRVLVEKPGYEPMVRTPAALGATVDRFLRPEHRLEPARVEQALTSDTRLVSVTNRHNPSGRLADRETLAAAAAAARERGARLLVDEVYGPYQTDPSGGGPFGGVTAAGLEGAVVTGSLSKFPGLPELRVGWLVADPEFVAAARQVKRHVPAVAGTSVALAQRALYHDDLAEEARDLLAENAALLSAFVAERPDVSGGVHTNFGLLDCGVDGDRLAEAAWAEGVLVVPGRFFGVPEAVRVGLGGSPEDGAAALGRLGDLLDALT
jgi:aspartate/methionine/tyrosine aminotransferase